MKRRDELKMEKFEVVPIGVVKSKYKTRGEAPRHGIESEVVSKIILYDDFIDILKEIKGREYLVILYWMHISDRNILRVESKGKGVFATRSPERPNPLGISVVEVVKIEGNELYVRYLDAIDNTPVIDMRPCLN